MTIGQIKYVMIIMALSVLSACASFKGGKVADVGEMPDVSQYQNKPSVFVDVRLLRGEPESGKAVVVGAAKEHVQKMIEPKMTELGVFSQVSFDQAKSAEMDYTLKVDIYNHGNNAAAAISGFISGFTFGVIPGVATDNYSVVTTLVDGNGVKQADKSSTDSMTTWIGWIFLPMSFKTPASVSSDVLNNQVQTAIKEMIESGDIKYSLDLLFTELKLASI